MRNRKTYFIILLVCCLVGLGSILYISSKTNELINYWGTDYVNEIYIHNYSIDKLAIQLFFLSICSTLSLIILLIFNIKKNIPFYTISTIGILLFVMFHIGLSINNTDRNLSELGTIDLGVSNKELIPTETTLDAAQPATTETINNYVPEPINQTKFVLLVYKVEVPYLAYQPSYYTPMNVKVDEFYYLDWIKGEAPSDVVEIQYFNNDNVYKLLDEQEKYVEIIPQGFKDDVETNIKDYSYKSYLLNLKVKIIDRYYLTFNSYAEASIKRQELLKTQSN